MKLTIERAALLKALAHVQSVVERRNTIPILSNVLITAHKGRLSLAATDMDLAITETVEANAGKTGSTTAPAHTLYEIVRKLPDGAQVELETASDGSTTPNSSSSRRLPTSRRLPCMSARIPRPTSSSHSSCWGISSSRSRMWRTTASPSG